jgi:hypothetical protein
MVLGQVPTAIPLLAGTLLISGRPHRSSQFLPAGINEWDVKTTGQASIRRDGPNQSPGTLNEGVQQR